jgi:hypothetical protein
MKPSGKRELDDRAAPSFVDAARSGKVLIGVVHLSPLPGSPRHDGRAAHEIVALARGDAERILEAGFDGYLIENFGDVPFHGDQVPPHVVALMTRVALELPRRGALVGVNVLRNDASAALAIAAACGLQMIRVNVHVGAMVTDQGILEGKASRTTRERATLSPRVAILADVKVKHAFPLGGEFDLEAAARDTAYRGLADALIVTGHSTGAPADLGELQAVRRAVPDRPVLVGSGVTAASVRDLLRVAQGIIVGTALKEGGRVEEPVDPARAVEIVREARRA